tara:strand:+ start:1773 stop:2090 length:318 start_codon:yes stop_codon:yes gene_type:complete
MNKLRYKIGELVQLRRHHIVTQGTGNYSHLVGIIVSIEDLNYTVRFFNYKPIFPEDYESSLKIIGDNRELVTLRAGDIQRVATTTAKHNALIQEHKNYKHEYYEM